MSTFIIVKVKIMTKKQLYIIECEKQIYFVVKKQPLYYGYNIQPESGKIQQTLAIN